MNGIRSGMLGKKKNRGGEFRGEPVGTDYLGPEVSSPSPALSAHLERCPWGMGERRQEQRKATASYTNMTFPTDLLGPGLSSWQRAEGNDENQHGNYLQPADPHISAQSCCQPSLPGRG